MAELGDEKPVWWDGAHPVRTRLDALVKCESCEAEIELWAETEEWFMHAESGWGHASFGPAQGVCQRCHLLYVDSFEGLQVYRLDAKRP